jgi:hypothetical protein
MMKNFKPDNLSKEFIDIIENLADALEVDPAIFIENIVIKRLADDRAADDVYQGGAELMPEFLQYEGKMLRGRELYKMLYNLKRQELERELYQQLKKVPTEDIHRLSEKDQNIINRYAPTCSKQDIKEQLQAEGDDVNDTSWSSDIKPEDMK